MTVQHGVYISYRREVSRPEARALAERLGRELGADRVMVGPADIEPGPGLSDLVERLLDDCAVQLVLIGPDWSATAGGQGPRRIDDDNDIVRVEVAAALRRDIRVIPVLCGAARLPASDDLPVELRPLVRRPAMPVDFDRLDAGLRPVIDAIQRVLGPGVAQTAQTPSRATARPSDPLEATLVEAKTLVLPATMVLPGGVTGAVNPAPIPKAQAQPESRAEPATSNAGSLPTRRLLAHALAAVGLVGLLATSVAPALLGSSAQHHAVFEAMVQSQRLAKSMSQALAGQATAFPEVRESVEVLGRNMRSLETGEGNVARLPGPLQGALDPVMPLVERAEKSAAVVLAQQKTLTQIGPSLRAVSRQSAELLETAETVSSLKLQQGASAAELFAVGQLVMLTQRVGKSANEFFTGEGVSAEAAAQLGQDLNSFKEIAQGVIGGSADLRLPGTRDPQVRERLQQLLAQYEQLRGDVSVILGNVQGLVAAVEAQGAVLKDSEPLRRSLAELAGRARPAVIGPVWPLLFGVALVLGILALLVPFPGLGNDARRR